MAVYYKGREINEIDYVKVEETVVEVKNQDKTVVITENGTQTITYDEGYTGLESVTINTNIETSSGGDDNLFEPIGYSSVPQYIQDGIEYAQTIYDTWDASITNRANAYTNDKKLMYFPLVDTSNVTTMANMFSGCTILQCVPQINTSNVTDMRYVFYGCSGLTSLDVSNFDTSACTNMSNMFSNCRSLTSLDLSNFNTSACTNMHSMFQYCSGLTSLDLSSFDTSNVTNMSCMFQGCSSLTSLDLSSFNTSAVINMNDMFRGCTNLTSLDVSNFDTRQVESISNMFYGCEKLERIDLSSFNTSAVTSMTFVFQDCDKLERIDGYLDWTKISSYPSYFTNAYELRYMTIKNLGKTGTTFNFNNNALKNWGDEDVETYPLSEGARQSLVDSLLTYSYDRAANGLSTCAIKVHTNVLARLTEDEITQIQNKGYTITT